MKNKDNILNASLATEFSQKYLAYALSTITHRALPDVRDGLKPVHRRLLYAMYLLNLGSKLQPKKSARVVGDVIGKFHPHGDQSVYDALVRLAQDFSIRYPLVNGQGNFGNIDGDNAAAMRYTEAKLTEISELLLENIDEETVDFKSTYDGDLQEPLVFPAKFPNLLANGATGSQIASILFESGVVKSSQAFFRVAVADARSQKVAPGSHRLTLKISARQALDQLLDPDRIPNLIRVAEGAWKSEVIKSFLAYGYTKRTEACVCLSPLCPACLGASC